MAIQYVTKSIRIVKEQWERLNTGRGSIIRVMDFIISDYIKNGNTEDFVKVSRPRRNQSYQVDLEKYEIFKEMVEKTQYSITDTLLNLIIRYNKTHNKILVCGLKIKLETLNKSQREAVLYCEEYKERYLLEAETIETGLEEYEEIIFTIINKNVTKDKLYWYGMDFLQRQNRA